MKNKIITAMFLAAALIVFGIGAAAQRLSANQAQPDQTTQGQSQTGTMGGGMMGGGMMGQGMGQGQGIGGGMMGMMGQMATHHQQMSALTTKLMESMTAIQNEKNPKALESKLAEHQVLLDQMRSQMMQQGNMMQMMSGQMRSVCPAAATDENSSSPTK